MLAKGTRAPEFELADQDGREHTLKSLLAGGPLILYFYPADFTPGCTKEACSFRDLHQDLMKAKLRVVGVSPQDVASHRKFADEHGLNFPLLADPDKVAVKAYDVDGPLGFGVRRGSFLIG
jgi:peroxiredoxin Q/BCP